MAGPTENPESAVRLSLISANSQPKDLEEGDYVGVKTPEQSGYSDHGALRPGGDPTITSRANIGLLYQYAVVGFISGVLPSTIYPLLQMYLNCSGAQMATASTLVSFPSSFKVFFGILSDCFPIFGNRRRPYILPPYWSLVSVCQSVRNGLGLINVTQIRAFYWLPSAAKAASIR